MRRTNKKGYLFQDPDQGSSGEENADPAKEKDAAPQISLTATMNSFDIASQLKNHFLANLPQQSYAWLNGLAGPPNTPQQPQEDMKQERRERTPLGGIK